jgi:uncharacterized membrane protein
MKEIEKVKRMKHKSIMHLKPAELTRLCKENCQTIYFWMFILLAVCMVINVVLSGYIMYQKNYNDSQASVDTCFLGDGGCYTVQTSSYARTFGIPNPYYGYFFFSIGAILFFGLALNVKYKFFSKSTVIDLADYILFGMIIGSLFSIWLLYVQYLILKTTCKYCLAVDFIMIGTTILFAWMWHSFKSKSAQEQLKEKLV